MNYFILVFLILFSFCLKEKIPQAKLGDYIVTESQKNYSLLFIRNIESDILHLEEISIPTNQIKTFKNKWQEWMQKGAPGHTAWVVYSIDLKQNKLISCYSFDRRNLVTLEDSFLTQLLSLPLVRQPQNERKKIGPPPLSGELDRRASWAPPIVWEGKKLEKPSVDVQITEWPDDGSQLAKCHIELYFDTTRPQFLFPCWIEIKSPHYTHHFKVADSGSGIKSPLTFLPNH